MDSGPTEGGFVMRSVVSTEAARHVSAAAIYAPLSLSLRSLDSAPGVLWKEHSSPRYLTDNHLTSRPRWASYAPANTMQPAFRSEKTHIVDRMGSQT